MNPGKSQRIIIGSKPNIDKLKSKYIPEVVIDGVIITRVSHAKNLGITYDEVLSWRRHVNVTVSKAYYKLRMLSRYKNFLTRQSKQLLCESLVLSYFNYCDVLFFNMNADLKLKVQRVQNSCIRFIYNLRKKDRVSITHYRLKLNWLSMDGRRLLHLYMQMYKISHGLAPDYLQSALSMRSEVHHYSTRSAQDFNITTRRTAEACKSFLYCAPILYDALPNEVKQINSIKAFQLKCKGMIFSSQVGVDT